MNAAISLCSFCEVHGPKVIFTTQTFRNYNENIENHEILKFYGAKDVVNQEKLNHSTAFNQEECCNACHSVGYLKYLSNQHETRTSFLSSQNSLVEDIRNLLKQACIRSLSCEVHPGKEGVCYFGDDARGHILSISFFLKDAEARGLQRWCSFIVLMRDKQYLLNMWPFLVENLKKIISELQNFAEDKYKKDEIECPQRVVRLTVSQSSSSKQPRGLTSITNEKHVFVRIHMWLVWILSVGARHFMEIIPTSLLDEEIRFNIQHQVETKEGFTLVNNFNQVRVTAFHEISRKNPVTILRQLKTILGKKDFQKILYSTLVGLQIVIRGPHNETLKPLYGLCSLLPIACQRIKVQVPEYVDSATYNFISLETSVAVPLPCSDICRLDILPLEHRTENTKSHVVRWTGELPVKLPTLMIKIQKALENEKLVDSVAKTHFLTLQEEWLNIAKIVHSMHEKGPRSNISSLLVSLGAGPQDKKLLEAWSMGLPSNPA